MPDTELTPARPAVTVVIPAYNIEAYVADAVRSVLAQDFRDWELVCVDDGSADGTAAECARAAVGDPRVRVVSLPHSGLGVARNVGVSMARGEWVCFLDGDDMLDPRALGRCLEAAREAGADVVQFGAEVRSLDGRPHDPGQYVRSRPYPGAWEGPALYVAQRRNGDYVPQACMCLARAGLYGPDATSAPEGVIHEDEWSTFSLLMSASRVVCLPDLLYVRRYRPGSIMSVRDWSASARGYFRAYALGLGLGAGGGTPAEALALHLEAQARACVGCFYRSRADLDAFPVVVGAGERDSEALSLMLARPELDPRGFSARRAAFLAREALARGSAPLRWRARGLADRAHGLLGSC